MCLDPA
jgi:serine/threonine protein phosphatase PrpC